MSCVLCYVWCVVLLCCFFFFKHKTAYEMRISDWSSDVCSSDLKATRSKVSRVLRQVRKNVMRQRFTVTEELLAQRSVQELLDPVELDRARVLVASGWFYYGKPERA